MTSDDTAYLDVSAHGAEIDIDLMDVGLDLLMTVETAMYTDSGLDPEALRAIRGTVGQALKFLRPVRDQINQAQG